VPGSWAWRHPENPLQYCWCCVQQVGLGKYGKDDAVFLANRLEVEEGERLGTVPVPLVTAGQVEMMKAAFEVGWAGHPVKGFSATEVCG
jgi:hypothetical protein